MILLIPASQNLNGSSYVSLRCRVLLSASRIQERSSNLSALAKIVRCVFFLRKNTLGDFGFGVV